MMIRAKISGAILGIPFGVPGVLFGVIVGTLVDQLLTLQRNKRDLEAFFTKGVFIPRMKRLARPAAAIALSVKMISLDQAYEEAAKNMVITSVRNFFSVRSLDEKQLEDFWNAAVRHESGLNISWLVKVYGISSPEFIELSQMYSYGGETERDFLFNLLHRLAGMDERGLSREEYGLMQEIFEPMGLGIREIRQRLRSMPYLNSRHLSLLELEQGCTEADVKARYRQMASRLHPDIQLNIGYGENSPSADEEERRREEFSRLQEAYANLLWQFRLYNPEGAKDGGDEV